MTSIFFDLIAGRVRLITVSYYLSERQQDNHGSSDDAESKSECACASSCDLLLMLCS